MREVLLLGGSGEAFDRSVAVARRLAESFGARLHVLYTVEDPLNAGWTSEMGAERMPDLHQAVEAEARERLSRPKAGGWRSALQPLAAKLSPCHSRARTRRRSSPTAAGLHISSVRAL